MNKSTEKRQRSAVNVDFSLPFSPQRSSESINMITTQDEKENGERTLVSDTIV
jgi:hypothetical protein